MGKSIRYISLKLIIKGKLKLLYSNWCTYVSLISVKYKDKHIKYNKSQLVYKSTIL